MIGIKIDDHGVIDELSVRASVLERPEGLMKNLGRTLQNLLRDHFRQKQKNEPNKLGGKRQNFWNQVRDVVQMPMQGQNTVSVTIYHPAFAQKVFGGLIEARPGKMLTIPVSPDAYGRTAGEPEAGGPSNFEAETGLKLFLIKVGGGKNNPFATAVLATARSGGIQVEYVLKHSVDQKPDPTALPPEDDLNAALLARADAYIARIIQYGDPGADTDTAS